MAHVANNVEIVDDSTTPEESKMERVSIEMDRIRLESNAKGAASSGDKPPTPGIVVRKKGIRTLADDLAQGLQQIADEPAGSEQGSVISEENRCSKCQKSKIQLRPRDSNLCECITDVNDLGMPLFEVTDDMPGSAKAPNAADDEHLLEAVSRQVLIECPECEFCGGKVTEPCWYMASTSDARECTMHGRITKAKTDIKVLTEECKDVWRPQFELDNLINHRTRLKMIKARINGEDWNGSKGPEDLYIDVDNYFRGIRTPQ